MPIISQLGISPKSLAVIPVISSSIFVTIGFEALSFLPFLQDPIYSEKAVSKWFTNYFYTGIFPIISLGTISTVTGVLAYKRGYGKLYEYGAIFASLHYAFVPIIMYPCQHMFENNQTKVALKKWITIHKFRLVTDIAATVCFTTALYKYVTQ